MSHTVQESNQIEKDTHRGEHRYLLYLGLVLIVVLVLYVLPVVGLRTKSLRSHVLTTFGPLLSTSYEVQHADADIVIFGDSTAMYGVDPLQVSRELGVKVINLPNTAGSLPVTGDRALQAYLQNNKIPRLVVFYFSSWNLNYEKNALLKERSFEGEEMLVRFGTTQEIKRYASRNKWSAIQFPFRMYFVGTGPTLQQMFSHDDAYQEAQHSLGHMQMPDSAQRMKEPCSIPARFLKPAGDDAVSTLRSTYTAQLQTMVFIAPVPNCLGAEELASRSFADLGAEPPKKLPADLYLADTLYAHPAPVGVSTATENFVAALRQRLSH